jgi:Galactose oxidase, central domain
LTWEEQAPATSPTPTYEAASAYDTSTGTVVLFGGQESPTDLLNQTWTWDGTTWTEQFPTTSPPARAFFSMAYDPVSESVVVFGGAYNGQIAYNDTWTWDGNDWTEVSPTISPSVRMSASMAFDTKTNTMLLFGGATANSDQSNERTLNETWSWNGSTWTELGPDNDPPARGDAVMGFDPITGQMVVFGGSNSTGPLNDTWTWDGTTWTEQSSEETPPERSGATMAFDGATDYLVLTGGGEDGSSKDDTWNWGYKALIISPTTLNVAKLGKQYSFDLSATGGVKPYAWTATSELPLGLRLSKSGTITGTPSTKLKRGSYLFSVEVTDSSSPTKLSAETDLSLTVK